MNRLDKVELPQKYEERYVMLKEYLFGPVTMTAADGFEMITSGNETECHTYVIIDSLKKSDISLLIEAWEMEWKPLWKGEIGEQYSLYAPYIVKIYQESKFTDWLIKTGWGNGWGIFIRSYLPLASLTHHLRKFNQIYDEVNSSWLLFRYYSPETIKNYLPYISVEDFTEFTNGIVQILCEGKDGDELLFM
ncbi:DUF4123 domain-containing protein [Klebsiella spallanzanii]|jgi:hypothetical protein|uniref:DUF4123 domain-containing protein n=1 Tax=Klebsiella spallanzanii TaxID=2587528 RepID=UPI00115A15C5|nr:DUF4123 domain-containing protein [Klebsiella spallanzanii]VUS79441.1 hypothetical protein SB6419_01164 [Klebsiella spallanzanii]